jgi:hypothetical protein
MAGGLGRFNFKFKTPHANVHFKAKAPKIRMKIKGGLKIKGGGLNLNKAAKAFASPFESMGRSATGLVTGALDSPSQLLQNVTDSASGLVSSVAQSAGEMAPQLLQSAAKMGLDSLVPGAGSLLNNLFPSSSSDQQGQQQDMPSLSDAALASDQAAQMFQQQTAKDPSSNDMLKYAAIGGVGLLAIFLLTNNSRGRK